MLSSYLPTLTDLSYLYNHNLKGPPQEASPVKPYGPVIYSVTKLLGGTLGFVYLGIHPGSDSTK